MIVISAFVIGVAVVLRPEVRRGGRTAESLCVPERVFQLSILEKQREHLAGCYFPLAHCELRCATCGNDIVHGHQSLIGQNENRSHRIRRSAMSRISLLRVWGHSSKENQVSRPQLRLSLSPILRFVSNVFLKALLILVCLYLLYAVVVYFLA